MNSNIRIALLVALVAGLFGSRSQAAETERYRLQPGDIVGIAVWNEANLQSDVIVRPDGWVTFALAGEQLAAGRSIEELRQAIEERLQKFIPDPVVTVSLKAIGGNRVYVVGKVARPGEFPFSKPLDVMQLLSLAGGATPFAALNDIRILRREGDKQVSISFRYEEVERGRNLNQNILLLSGDTVVVP